MMQSGSKEYVRFSPILDKNPELLEDIDNNFIQKGKKLVLQIDVTATPKHKKGEIFLQTISDYPLVEAIHQGVC